MGLLLIIIGLVLLMSAVNDKIGDLGTMVENDMLGSGQSAGFLLWAAAIIVIAAVFRLADLPDAGRFLVILVVVAYLLGHADIPGQFLEQLQAVGGAAATSGDQSAFGNVTGLRRKAKQ